MSAAEHLADCPLNNRSEHSESWFDLHVVADDAAATGVVQATVWAETCAEAEIWAKQALLTGVSVLAWQGAVLVMEDGRMLTSLEGPDRLGFDREPQEVGA